MTDKLKGEEKILPFQISPENAVEQFKKAMTKGVFRPRDIGEKGSWSQPQQLFIPIRRARVVLSVNWSAESGNIGSDKKTVWTPVTGTHRGEYNDVMIPAADGPWNNVVNGITRNISGYRFEPRGDLGETKVIEATKSIEETRKAAVSWAEKREESACRNMVPGAKKRRLKINANVEEYQFEEVLVPVYSLHLEYEHKAYAGFVDGITGNVFAKKPTSRKRVFIAFGSAVGLVVLAIVAVIVVSTISADKAAKQREQEQAEQERKRVAHLEQLATELEQSRVSLSASLDLVEEKMKVRDVKAAKSEMSKVELKLKRFRKELDPKKVEELWSRFSGLRPTLAHLEVVARGLESSQNVVSNKDLCDTPKKIADAWKDLRKVTPKDPERNKAVRLARRLERCRKKAERNLSAGLKKIMVTQRQGIAEQLERTFLDQGWDVRVNILGASKNMLKLTFVLFSRALVHKVTNGGSMEKGAFLSNLQDVGFRKVIFSDGFKSSWNYSLKPPDENGGGKKVLEGLDIGEPLRLNK